MNNPDPNEATTRTVIIGSLDDERTTEQVVWVQPTHQDAPLAIPAPWVATKVNCEGQTVFWLEDAHAHGTTIVVADVRNTPLTRKATPPCKTLLTCGLSLVKRHKTNRNPKHQHQR